MNRLLFFVLACFAAVPRAQATDPPDPRTLRPGSPEAREVARLVYATAPPKLSLTQAITLVRHSYQKMPLGYRRALFLSSARFVRVSDPQAGQPASTPFWEIKYAWNYRPDWEAEIFGSVQVS